MASKPNKPPQPQAHESARAGGKPSASAGPGARPARASTAGPPSPTPRILFLDDDPERARRFLERHPQAVWVQTASDCIQRLAETWDEVHLDHDLGGEVYVDSARADCGMEVVRWLCLKRRGHCVRTRFFVHSYNEEAAELMVSRLREAEYAAVYRPFGLADFAAPAPGPAGPPTPPASGVKLPPWMERLSRPLRRPRTGPADPKPPPEETRKPRRDARAKEKPDASGA